jgi:hypothetical protein
MAVFVKRSGTNNSGQGFEGLVFPMSCRFQLTLIIQLRFLCEMRYFNFIYSYSFLTVSITQVPYLPASIHLLT